MKPIKPVKRILNKTPSTGNKPNNEWEKEFDKKFGNNLELNEGMTGIEVEEYHSNATRKVKNFISKLLLTQRQQLISEIKSCIVEGSEDVDWEKLKILEKK